MSEEYRSHVLTWFGGIGTAITLLGSIEPFLQLADWCRIIVASWHDWTTAFWNMITTALNIRIPETLRSMLTASFFILFMAIGVRIAALARGERDQLRDELDPVGRSHQLARSIERIESVLPPDSGFGRVIMRAMIGGEQAKLRAIYLDQVKASKMALFNPLMHIYVLIVGAGLYKSGFDFGFLNDELVIWAMFVGFWTGATVVATKIAPITRLHSRARWVLVGLFVLVALNYASIFSGDIAKFIRPQAG
ncbi:MAG: hypothetical protein F9K44_13905 [Hyphomicrobiaceae bacterium]|nr:MAG: hypothetical protein F9K44_13905 [Hyphomicrobiaceae bacterium]